MEFPIDACFDGISVAGRNEDFGIAFMLDGFGFAFACFACVFAAVLNDVAAIFAFLDSIFFADRGFVGAALFRGDVIGAGAVCTRLVFAAYIATVAAVLWVSVFIDAAVAAFDLLALALIGGIFDAFTVEAVFVRATFDVASAAVGVV